MQNALDRVNQRNQNQLEQLKLLFDYTKFHIGLYTALATIVAAALAIKDSDSQRLFQFNSVLLSLAVLAICLAGFAGGVIASSIPGFASYDKFWRTRIGPMRCRLMTAEYWTYLEHWAFWAAVVLAVLSIAVKRIAFLAYLGGLVCLP